MRTRKIEVTITYDPASDEAAQYADTFAEWIGDEVRCWNDDNNEYPEDQIHDLTVQVTDLD